MAFSAVLFDFDGVLVDTEWAIYQAWKRTFEAHGQHLPLEIYTRCIGTDFNTWSPKTHLEELTGQAFDWHDLDARRQEEIMKDLDHEGPMHGVVPLLETLSAIAMPTSVVSSSSHKWVDGWLKKLGLTHHFQTTVCRGDAPRIKPAPDLFLAASERLGVAPEHCLVIEDSFNGLKAAKQAGMSVWIVPNRVTQCLDFSPADRVFRSLAECVGSFETDPTIRMTYIRFQSSEISPYTGRKYGVFVAVWHLVRDKRVTEDEETEYWRQREWFEENLPIPPFYAEGNPQRAVTWFKREALTDEMKTRLTFYLSLGSRYGIMFEEETADSFTEIIYEDPYQIAVI